MSHAFRNAAAFSTEACTRANTFMAHPTEALCKHPAQHIFQGCKHEALLHTQQKLHVHFARRCLAHASDAWGRPN